LEVQDVSGTEITMLVTVHYIDGREEINTLTWDIEMGREPWIIPANLNTGDEFTFGYNAVNLNDTLTLTYAGASRAVNFLHLEKQDEYTEMMEYLDKISGDEKKEEEFLNQVADRFRKERAKAKVAQEMEKEEIPPDDGEVIDEGQLDLNAEE